MKVIFKLSILSTVLFQSESSQHQSLQDERKVLLRSFHLNVHKKNLQKPVNGHNEPNVLGRKIHSLENYDHCNQTC